MDMNSLNPSSLPPSKNNGGRLSSLEKVKRQSKQGCCTEGMVVHKARAGTLW